MRRSLLLLYLLLTCCSPRQTSSENLYQEAERNLRRGNLQQALELAKRGGLPWRDQADSEQHWRFRLLEAEILISRGKSKDAVTLLNVPPLDRVELASLEPRRKMLQGNALLKLSNYAESGRLLEEAHQQASTLRNPDLLLQIEVAKGVLFSMQDRMEDAEAILRTALERAVQQKDRYYQAAALNTLGMNRVTNFRFDEAIPFFQRALAAAEEVEAQLFSAAILGNLGLCSYRLGDFEKALTFRQKALELQERAEALFAIQHSLAELGNIYYLQDEPRKAIPYYRRALDLARQLNALSDASKWARNLAAALAEVQDWDAAERVNNESLSLDQDVQGTRAQAYLKLNAAVIAAGRKRHSEAAQIYKDVIESAKDNRSLEWEAHAGLASLYADTGDQKSANSHFERAIAIIEKNRAGLLQTDYKITFLSRLIRFYQAYVDALITQGDDQKALQVADSSRARILAEKLGSSGTIDAGAAFTDWRKIARRSNTVLLSYWLAPRRSFLWVITPDQSRFFVLPKDKEIASLVENYRKFIEESNNPLANKHAAGSQLYGMLIAPAKELVPADSRVILIPDGCLHSLNFETLPLYGERARYWIDDITLAIAPSLSVLSRENARRPQPPKSLLIIGDPDAADSEFPRLPHARAEVASIRQYFGPIEKRVFTGAQANPAAYREAQPERFSIIHFAAHAVANRQSPLDSAVILSRKSDSFKLYARDVIDLPLDAELVTISGCRSAGARSFSGEGLVGFVWAFFRAGARNVLAGLWDVNDSSTAELMAKFYAQLDSGKDPAEALRSAKLQLKSERAYSKPYYWAPFQLFTRSSPFRETSAISAAPSAASKLRKGS